LIAKQRFECGGSRPGRALLSPSVADHDAPIATVDVIHVEGGGEGEVMCLEAHVPPNCSTLDGVDMEISPAYDNGREGLGRAGRMADEAVVFDLFVSSPDDAVVERRRVESVVSRLKVASQRVLKLA